MIQYWGGEDYFLVLHWGEIRGAETWCMDLCKSCVCKKQLKHHNLWFLWNFMTKSLILLVWNTLLIVGTIEIYKVCKELFCTLSERLFLHQNKPTYFLNICHPSGQKMALMFLHLDHNHIQNFVVYNFRNWFLVIKLSVYICLYPFFNYFLCATGRLKRLTE